MTEEFDDVRDALDALAEGRVSAERVREEFGDVDGIGRSISVAVGQRERRITDEEWRESFSADFEFDEGALNWPSDWGDEERVECYVGAAIDEVAIVDIAEACGLSEDKTRRIVEEFAAEDDALVSTGDDVWAWDEEVLRDQQRKRFAEKPEEELRRMLERIESEIDEWRDEFDADSPDDVGDKEVAYDWRHNQHTRELIQAVLDDKRDS
ncbi:hypothetical protein JCM17823_23850 [Halorubrum gandharaense]